MDDLSNGTIAIRSLDTLSVQTQAMAFLKWQREWIKTIAVGIIACATLALIKNGQIPENEPSDSFVSYAGRQLKQQLENFLAPQKKAQAAS